MLTSADDYAIHQLPEPIAYATGERNFYDRYFFNGYLPDASLFFAAALGVYPQLGVMDAAFSVVRDGRQHNLRASMAPERLERMATRVGPIAVEVIEPLRALRVRVDSHEHGVHADLVFHRRCPAVQEPRFQRRAGARTVMDLTRLTQNGSWSGKLELEGRAIEIEPGRVLGTRDRSWGLRAVGAPDPQPARSEPQFYWLWAPLNFSDCVTLYHQNTDGDGRAWSSYGARVPLVNAATEDPEPEIFEQTSSSLRFQSGTRHAAAATLSLARPSDGLELRIELVRRLDFYMSGIGYLHPEWGHGRYRGVLDTAYEVEALGRIDVNDPLHLHVQALCTASLIDSRRGEQQGVGVLEQLILGRHAPSGLEAPLGPASRVS
jgi:hypothetical protein